MPAVAIRRRRCVPPPRANACALAGAYQPQHPAAADPLLPPAAASPPPAGSAARLPGSRLAARPPARPRSGCNSSSQQPARQKKEVGSGGRQRAAAAAVVPSWHPALAAGKDPPTANVRSIAVQYQASGGGTTRTQELAQLLPQLPAMPLLDWSHLLFRRTAGGDLRSSRGPQIVAVMYTSCRSIRTGPLSPVGGMRGERRSAALRA